MNSEQVSCVPLCFFLRVRPNCETDMDGFRSMWLLSSRIHFAFETYNVVVPLHYSLLQSHSFQGPALERKSARYPQNQARDF